MPGGDRTGPLGYGPATGRGLGYCTANSFRRPGFGGMGSMGSMGRMGRGMGRMANRGGFGFGVGFMNNPNYAGTPDPESEKIFLKNQEQYLKEELKRVQSTLSEIDKNPEN